MLNLFKKKPKGQELTLKIEGMHCTSCAMNIDGALEDTEGVITAQTSYAKSQTRINYDPAKVNTKKLRETIESLEYTVKDST